MATQLLRAVLLPCYVSHLWVLHNSACPALLFCAANKAWLLFPEIQTDHNYVLQNYCNTDFKLKSANALLWRISAVYEFFWPHSWASIIKRQTLGKLCGSELKCDFQKVFMSMCLRNYGLVSFAWSGNQTYYLKENDVKEKTKFDHLIKRIFAILWRRTFFAIHGDFKEYSLVSQLIMNAATNKPRQSLLMLLLYLSACTQELFSWAFSPRGCLHVKVNMTASAWCGMFYIEL